MSAVTDAMVDVANAAIAERRGMRAAIEAALAVSWQPIETAPKNGDEIILGCSRGKERWSESGFWHDGSENYWKSSGWYSEMDRGNLLTATRSNPTHWMPFPEPPQ